ncbi:MAG: nuclear transport factor 2 family protein [Acidimicrobiia bacterium]
MDAELELKLRELIAKQEITELVYQRARVLDRHEPTQLDSFTEDATTTHEGWHGTMKEFLATRSGTAPGRAKGQIMDHFITNVLVYLDDDSHARVHSYHLCTHTTPAEIEPQFDRIVVGRYFDWVVRTSDGWKIKHRDAVFDWSISIPAGERMWARHIGSEHMLVGANDRSDPFFTRFETGRERK